MLPNLDCDCPKVLSIPILELVLLKSNFNCEVNPLMFDTVDLAVRGLEGMFFSISLRVTLF